jgi:opacity protein-like surface antigen
MKRLIAAALFALIANSAVAAEKAVPVAECGQMWKAHKASEGYADPGKGKRMDAWNDFRRTKCGKDRS